MIERSSSRVGVRRPFAARIEWRASSQVGAGCELLLLIDILD